jgi:3-isopropylmalate/(R)-2-methylmalate dehydratase small subunit
MQSLRHHTGRCAVLPRDDIDTDQIIPAEFCKRLTKDGYADALFAHWRKDPDFVLNRAASAGATVLVAAANFGTGSSREHAVWALRDWGLRVVVASSFGDIFLRNAWKNGVMAVQLPAPVVASLAAEATADPAFEITVDLVDTEVRAGDERHRFPVDENARWLLLEGLDDIDVTLRHVDAIAGYERSRPPWLPGLSRGCVDRRLGRSLGATP